MKSNENETIIVFLWVNNVESLSIYSSSLKDCLLRSSHKKYSNAVVLLLAESVSITLEPDNPTQVLVNSEVVLRWNYTLGGDRFREVEFRRTRTGADEKIGLIDREVFLYSAFRSGRFEVQAPATLVIRNVTADDATDYILTVEAKTSSDIVTAESSITLDVLREFPFVFLRWLDWIFLG